MNGIYSSYWIIKKYQANGKPFYFFIGTLQLNMLNTLECINRGRRYSSYVVKEISLEHWIVTDPQDPSVEYEIKHSVERPEVPDNSPFSVQDLRGPLTVPLKKLPKTLTFKQMEF